MYGRGKLGPVMAVVGTDTSTIANKKRKKKKRGGMLYIRRIKVGDRKELYLYI
jgi:hypothetical protein